MTTLFDTSLPDDDALYAALVARSADYDGRAFVGVTTTGIFCRLSCPARKPKRENSRFFADAASCLEAGFHPCKRCRPMQNGAPEPLVAELLAALDAEPSRRWSEADLFALGHDPSTVRRTFKRALGRTFLETARLHRLRTGAVTQKQGGQVIDAQLDAGFESASGFRAAFAKLTGRAPGTLDRQARLVADFISTPLGPMIAVADDEAVWLVEFADRKELPREIAAVEKQAGSAIGFGESAVIAQLKAELDAFFGGARSTFRVPIHPYGTDFMQMVHAGLRRIPPGTTLSYGALAQKLGRPTAMRAVARANAANRLAVIVPCHRVIAADGTIAGYAGGVWRKEWLLNHERQFSGT
ncbi:MAG: trifunctional transcriptional activator/DNA repair protein Ada/methylated-DNA--[protein]-cysteine S-methyltransferase [Pseudomonadota bacterium]